MITSTEKVNDIKKMLLEKGYRLEKSSYIAHPNTRVQKEFYISPSNLCVAFVKIGRMKMHIRLYVGWNRKYPNAGQEVKYGATLEDISEFVENPDAFIKAEKLKAILFAQNDNEDEDDYLPFN